MDEVKCERYVCCVVGVEELSYVFVWRELGKKVRFCMEGVEGGRYVFMEGLEGGRY